VSGRCYIRPPTTLSGCKLTVDACTVQYCSRLVSQVGVYEYTGIEYCLSVLDKDRGASSYQLDNGVTS
jgi:hypothetical protein